MFDSGQPFLPVAAPIVGERELAYVTDAVRSGWVSSAGPYIGKFEQAFACFVGTTHAVSTVNGTTALHLALHALGIRQHDEVIVPDLTFVAPAHAVLQVGATPVLVDVDPETWCMDPRALERAITPSTRAVIPVHLYGHPADMPAIRALADAHGIKVVEDCAEAHGAAIDGRVVGSLGTMGAFSFYGNKVITCGEGGMLTTNDSELAARVRFLKDHGMSPERRYYHSEIAFNYRMTNLQAALGLAQLEQIDSFLAKKNQILEWYRAGLSGLPNLALNPVHHHHKSIVWMVCVVLPEGARITRDETTARLRERGIDSRPFFVPLSQLPHLADCRRVGATHDACPVAERLSRCGLNLPSGCDLTHRDVDRVCGAVRSLLR